MAVEHETHGSTGRSVDTEEALRAWLRAAVAKRVGIEPEAVDLTERFNRIGLDSLGGVGLVGELSQVLGRTLSPTVVWDQPTIEQLAKHLFADPDESADAERSGSVAPSVATEPIAIVGLACRLPGAPDPAAYWKLLRDGVDAIREVPPERWSLEDYYEEDRNAPGKMNTRWGGFLERVDGFDPGFFGISPREALHMDPQQRLFLELAWEALEDAGVPSDVLRGTRTGVFVGAMGSDYARLPGLQGQNVTQHTATGVDSSIISARLSYTLGLQGPSMTINTACSSALVAVYLACQSLRNGECTRAIAGGVNILATPEGTVHMSKFGGMSPDGRSKAFDERADGYVRAEGGGAVMLKPLSRALADGDPIYCVIRGGAVNNDGFSNGLVAPNPQAQASMLRDACAAAGVEPSMIDYVEAHGTGTALGDPIEAGALGAVLGRGRAPEDALVIGSVKANIGHLEAGAGIAGLIKVALSIKNGRIPPLVHLQTPNPNIDFEALGLTLPRAFHHWNRRSGVALAGVSAFGFGGTNCHLVLEEVPESRARMFALAAPDAETLATQVDALRSSNAVAEEWSEVQAPSGTGEYRSTFVANSHEELDRALGGYRGPAGASAPDPRPVFVFSGNGSQWLGMGRALLRSEPAFRKVLLRCDQALAPFADWSLLDELVADEATSRLDEVGVSQTLLFGVQVALAELWRSWGVEPAAVVGHSGAEISAACAAGALSVDDAARIVFHRSRLQGRTAGAGRMAVLPLSAEEAERALAGRDDVVIAGSNAPMRTVVSGASASVEALVSELVANGVEAALVRVDIASHSPQMVPLADDLRTSLEGIGPVPSDVPIVSTVTGETINGTELGPEYWVRNMLEPVQYLAAVQHLAQAGHRTFLEIAPHPILSHPTEEILLKSDVERPQVLASLVRDEDEQRSLLESLARFVEGGLEHAGERTPPRDFQLVTLSANDTDALREMAQRAADRVENDPDLRLDDVAYTSSARRAHLSERLALTVREREDFVEAANAFVRGEVRPEFAVRRRLTTSQPRVAFVMSGMGSQWWPMARELYHSEPVFRRMIQRCDGEFRKYANWSVVEELLCEERNSGLARMEVAQPAVFAVQVALAALWRSWGLVPHAVVGHSAGETTAAYVSGALGLEDAARVCFLRSKLLQSAAGDGRMLAVGLGVDEVQPYLESFAGRVDIGAVNSPKSLTLSGQTDAIGELAELFEAEGVFCRVPKIDLAGHSFMMEPLKAQLLEGVAGIRPGKPFTSLYSTVTAERVGDGELNENYWWMNLRKPVAFAQAIGNIVESGIHAFVEVAPHPVLSVSVAQCLEGRTDDILVAPSMKRDESEREIILRSAGALFSLGVDLDWDRLHPQAGRFVSLPLYPWQREPYWPTAREAAPAKGSSHPLLDRSIGAVQTGWEFEIRPDKPEYLLDHKVQGDVVFPAAGYLETIFAAASEALGAGESLTVRNLACTHAMRLAEERRTLVEVSLKPGDGGQWGFEVRSKHEEDGDRTSHCSGVVSRRAEPAPRTTDLESLRARCTNEADLDELYRHFEECGLEYGPAFRCIRELRSSGDEAFSRLSTDDEAAYLAHPALTDAAIQTALAAAGSGIESTHLPVMIARLDVLGRLEGTVYCHARINGQNVRGIHAEFSVYDSEGRLLMRAQGLECLSLESGAPARDVADLHYREVWQSLRPPFATPQETAERVRAKTEGEWSDELERIAKVEARMPDVEQLCGLFARRAFRELGWDPDATDAAQWPAPDALRAQLGIDDAHHRFVPLLLDVLRRTCKARDGDDPDQRYEALRAELPEFELELSLLYRCAGQNLAEILRTPSLALQLLFQDDALERWYTQSPTYRLFALQMTATVEELVRSLPEDRTVRILEVGAGTGALPSFLLEKLPAGRVEYVFTDISASFFSTAQTKFGAYPWVTYRTLDLERDATEQGFELESFDLVLANDVLHATRDLKETLTGIEGLLAPGGQLVILDVTDCPTWIDMVFGCIDGWWRFEDLDLRPKHATASRSTWKKLLSENGFEDVVSVSNRDEGEYVHAVFTARKAATEPRRRAAARRRLVLADDDAFRGELVELLRGEGSGEVLVAARGVAFDQVDERRFACDPTQRASLAALLDAAGELDEIVHLWSPKEPGTSPLGLLHVAQELIARENPPRLVIVTRGAQVEGAQPSEAAAVGFGRTLVNEHPELEVVMLDFDPAEGAAALADALCTALPCNEIAVRDGQVLLPRLLHRRPVDRQRVVPARSGTPFRLEIKEPGSIDRLAFYECERPAPGRGQVQVEVHAASMNFIDVVATMKMHPDPSFYDPESENFHPLGGECSGRIVAVGEGVEGFAPGDEVIAIADYSMGSFVTTPVELVSKKPANLSFLDAAAIPDVFLTVHYSFEVLARLSRGERVLIHSAAGGVGLAAIQYARNAGAEIFATAGTPEKRELLRSMGVEHVMDSRSLDWAEEILEKTGGKGVDVVLNSLAGAAIPKGLEVLAPYGRFVELGVRDIFDDARIGLSPFQRDLSFFAVDLHRMTRVRPEQIREMLGDVLAYFESGALEPLPRTTFPAAQVHDAFRYMTRGTHVGKIVLDFADEQEVNVAASEHFFRPNATYLVTGGLGGFGLTLIEWMAARGARHLLLTSRSGAVTTRAERLIARLAKKGCRVEVARADAGDRATMKQLFGDLGKRGLPPLAGVFHLAMVLDDDFIERLDAERFERVMRPKAAGAFVLDELTRDLLLDWFVLFSSSAGVVGNSQQSNYVAANCVLDALAQQRTRTGLPAISINWGVLSGVGRVARSRRLSEVQEARGLLAVTPDEALDALAAILRDAPAQHCFMDTDWAAVSRVWRGSPRIDHLLLPEEGAGDEGDSELDLATRLVNKVGALLGISASAVDRGVPLARLGLDSLMAFELVSWLDTRAGIQVSQLELLDETTVEDLLAKV